MRYLAASDIHGHFEKYMMVLGEYKWNPNKDMLCVAGDIIDGGRNEKKVDEIKLVEFIMKWNKLGKLLYAKGNHDYHFEINTKRLLKNPKKKYSQEYVVRITKEFRNWLKNQPAQVQTKDYIITHGMYFPNLNNGGNRFHKMYASPALIDCPVECWNYRNLIKMGNLDDFSKENLIKYKDGICPWNSIDEYTKNLNKRVIIGHFYANIFRHGHKCGVRTKSRDFDQVSKDDNDVWKSNDGKLIAIDGCVYAKNGKINLYVWEEK